MRASLTRTFAILGWVTALAAAVGAIALRIVDPAPFIQTGFGFSEPALVGFEFLGLTFAGVGALLVVRRPRNAVGWFMVLIGDGYALAGLTAAATFSAVADGPAGAAAAGYFGWLTVVFTTLGGLVFGLGFIFPTGRGHTLMWDRFLQLAIFVTPVLFAVLFLIRPGALHVFPGIDNPFGIGPDLRPILGPDASSVIAGSSGFFFPFLAWSIVSRYRMSDDIGRRQLKWFILAMLVTLAAVGITAVSAMQTGRAPEIGLIVFGFAGALVPISIGIAILRYHLYDIDRIISRSLAYAIVTGVLAAVFAATAIGISTALGTMAEGQSLSVAGATLFVLALFGPLRRRAQSAIDRRFDRSNYDASMTVQALTERLRDDVDLERVEADVLGVLDRTFHPARAGMWLRGTTR
jgi:hypothetical protein